MIYELPLQITGVLTGIILVLGHAAALIQPKAVMGFCKSFPRSRAAAGVLLFVAAVWSFILVRTIDLGEFSGLRNVLLIGVPVGAILAWLYVQEFLAVRSLGMVLLLAAEPLLESAVLRGEGTRLALVLVGYAWATAGLFLVGMPYLLRDAITWVSHTPLRWKIAAAAGLAWGLVVLALAVFFW